MKVYLSEPRHYLYDELQERPPECVQYVRRSFSPRALLRASPRQAAAYLRNKALSDINTHVVLSESDFDLIHSNGSVIPAPQTPWVVDFEDGTALTFLQTPTDEEKDRILDFLSDPQCRRLLPHCKAAKKSFFNIFDPPKRVKQKTEVVYPAFRVPDKKEKESSKVSLLFVAREFERKGGYEAYRAFEELDEVYEDIEFICVSSAPREVEETAPDNARFYEDIERQKLYELYCESDVFVYPTFHDTFGMVMLEAMAFGTPVVTIEDFATPEIVSNGEDGFIVEGYETKWFEKDTNIRIDKFNDWERLRAEHTEREKDRIVSDIVEKCAMIIEDESRRKEMSEQAREKIKSGKFSIRRRNKKLSRFYGSAVGEES